MARRSGPAAIYTWLGGLLLLHLLPFCTRPALIGGDEPHYALMAHSLAADLDADLRDDYEEVAAGSPAAGRKRAGQVLDRHLRVIGGREVFAHPLGLPLIVAPLVFLQETLAPGSAPDLLLGLTTALVTFAGLVGGWWLVSVLLGNSRYGAVVAFGGYFSSPLWFYGRTFFTEPYTWAFAVLAIAAIASGRLWLASLLLALTLAMKETALLLVAPILAACSALLGMRRTRILAIGPVLFGIAFLAKNVAVTGTPFSTFQPFAVGDPWRGAMGLIFDPAHGLLWFAPLLVASGVGWALRTDDTAMRWLRRSSMAAFLLYLVVTAAWIDWAGGSSYATRLLLPVLPALVLPAVRLFAAVPSRARQAAFVLLFLFGFVVNWCAALDPFHAFWGIAVTDLLLRSWPVAIAGSVAGLGLIYLLARGFPEVSMESFGDRRTR